MIDTLLSRAGSLLQGMALDSDNSSVSLAKLDIYPRDIIVANAKVAIRRRQQTALLGLRQVRPKAISDKYQALNSVQYTTNKVRVWDPIDFQASCYRISRRVLRQLTVRTVVPPIGFAVRWRNPLDGTRQRHNPA
ncbi:hypothetical protein [Pseudomonas sp. NPDC087817]|uniref:hypothetical protein n=1 Tax=Pseudomonas sp. NPDC087817 TaxID=3364451 RepID=UPI0028E63101|nr:hypothetical protein [uncultured Pseudomonas sp.]